MQYSSVCLAFIVSMLIAHAFCLPVSLCLVGEIWHTDILIFQKWSDFESEKRERGKGKSCTFGRCNVVSSYPQEDRPCVLVILMTAALMMFIHRCPPERWSPHHICGKKYFCKSPTIIDGCCEESSGGVLAQRCKKMFTFLPSKWQSFLLLGGQRHYLLQTESLSCWISICHLLFLYLLQISMLMKKCHLMYSTYLNSLLRHCCLGENTLVSEQAGNGPQGGYAKKGESLSWTVKIHLIQSVELRELFSDQM